MYNSSDRDKVQQDAMKDGGQKRDIVWCTGMRHKRLVDLVFKGLMSLGPIYLSMSRALSGSKPPVRMNLMM